MKGIKVYKLIILIAFVIILIGCSSKEPNNILGQTDTVYVDKNILEGIFQEPLISVENRQRDNVYTFRWVIYSELPNYYNVEIYLKDSSWEIFSDINTHIIPEFYSDSIVFWEKWSDIDGKKTPSEALAMFDLTGCEYKIIFDIE